MIEWMIAIQLKLISFNEPFLIHGSIFSHIKWIYFILFMMMKIQFTHAHTWQWWEEWEQKKQQICILIHIHCLVKHVNEQISKFFVRAKRISDDDRKEWQLVLNKFNFHEFNFPLPISIQIYFYEKFSLIISLYMWIMFVIISLKIAHNCYSAHISHTHSVSSYALVTHRMNFFVAFSQKKNYELYQINAIIIHYIHSPHTYIYYSSLLIYFDYIKLFNELPSWSFIY